ncbi:MAG: alpha/beta fold hydrolase [Pseudomonadota bacterium]
MASSPRWRYYLLRAGIACAITYGSILVATMVGETGAVYRPSPGPTEPAAAGLPNYTRKTLAHGTQPPITYWENGAPAGAPTVLYFHGNGGGLYRYASALAFLDKQHVHVVAMEYRGYPGALGSPSQRSIVRDAQALYDHLKTTQPGIALWGYSLGSGVATQLAATRPVTALVLEAPFTAAVDLAGEMFPYLPVQVLMRNSYRSRAVIGQINVPLFIMHGGADRVVPVAHGRALFEQANQPKILRIASQANHFNLIQYGAYDEAVDFLRQAPRPSYKPLIP